MALRISVASALLFSCFAVPCFSAGGFEEFLNEYKRNNENVQQQFTAYKKKQDEEFANFLSGTWREFDAVQGKPRMTLPEPVKAPVYNPDQPSKIEKTHGRRTEQALEKAIAQAPVPLMGNETLPSVKQEKQSHPLVVGDRWMTLGFYGNELTLPTEAAWRNYRLPGGDKPAALSAFWENMSASPYQRAVDALVEYRNRLQLDDWAWIKLWQRYVAQLQANNETVRNLQLWFFLVKSGLDVRIAYFNDEVYVLVAVRQQVYESPQFRFDGKVYYPVFAPQFGKGISRFYSYDANYPGKLRMLELSSINADFAKPLIAERKLSFSFQEKPVTLAANYNAAVQFLLTLVQQSFDYKTNAEQFGREKAFFVDDAFHFPYSDCKARAVLFAWLVRNVLGLNVLALHYENHLSTAVALKVKKPGWAIIEHEGLAYVYADPTYIGAPVGKQQREYQGVKPIRFVKM